MSDKITQKESNSDVIENPSYNDIIKAERFWENG
jgi:hypothetical protein